MTYKQIINEAKKAFKNEVKTKPYFKKIGFVSGTKEVLVWR